MMGALRGVVKNTSFDWVPYRIYDALRGCQKNMEAGYADSSRLSLISIKLVPAGPPSHQGPTFQDPNLL